MQIVFVVGTQTHLNGGLQLVTLRHVGFHEGDSVGKAERGAQHSDLLEEHEVLAEAYPQLRKYAVCYVLV